MKVILGTAAALAALATAASAIAGGWSTTTLDPMPEEIQEGEEFEVGFVVKQHGQDPVNDAFGEPLEPVVVATNADSGEEVEFVARQEGAEGHFVADVSLPSAGAWEWTIYTAPLENTSKLEPLTVSSNADSTSASAMGLEGRELAGAFGLGALFIALVGATLVRRISAS